MNQLKQNLQENFDTTMISAQIISFTTFDETGMKVQAEQIVVLDAQDRFMFLITPEQANDYVFDGFINYEKIYKDYILTKEQWDSRQETNEVQEETQKEID